jgi:hypothetical protein
MRNGVGALAQSVISLHRLPMVGVQFMAQVVVVLALLVI